jgi:ribosomal protein S18 acetylase RimI-like enzyme
LIGETDITLARPADAAAIAQLSRDAIEHGLSWRWTARRVARSIRDVSTNAIVGRRGSSFLGFAIMKYDEEVSHLLLLAVAPGYRRQGVASTLLAWLEATVRAAGISTVQVETRARNDSGIAFYRQRGFDHAGVYPGYYEGVEDAVRLVKDLSRSPG